MQQYWQRIRTGMGAARVDSFARYYEIPGIARYKGAGDINLAPSYSCAVP